MKERQDKMHKQESKDGDQIKFKTHNQSNVQ